MRYKTPHRRRDVSFTIKTCENELRKRKEKYVVRFVGVGIPLSDAHISDRAWQALIVLKAEFKAALARDDEAATEALRHEAAVLLDEFGILGRPTGSSPPKPPELPSSQPLQWNDRADDDNRTPPEFIRDEYKGRKGLKRADILHLDPPLYRSLAKWLRLNPMPDWLDLPTKKQANDQEISELRAKGTTEDMSARDYLRLRSAAARRNLSHE